MQKETNAYRRNSFRATTGGTKKVQHNARIGWGRETQLYTLKKKSFGQNPVGTIQEKRAKTYARPWSFSHFTY